MPDKPVKAFDRTVEVLSRQLFHGGNSLKQVPETLKAVLGKNRWGEPMWPERICAKTGEVVTFDSFQQFVETEPPHGLGATVQMLKNLCRDDTEALDLIDQAVRREVGANQWEGPSNSMTQGAQQGTTRDYALSRLRRERPDLHQRVLAGELSPHAAMVEAGFRRRSFTVPDDPERAAEALVRRFGEDGAERVVQAIMARRKDRAA
jgi:hypothetical protein